MNVKPPSTQRRKEAKGAKKTSFDAERTESTGARRKHPSPLTAYHLPLTTHPSPLKIATIHNTCAAGQTAQALAALRDSPAKAKAKFILATDAKMTSSVEPAKGRKHKVGAKS